MEPTFSLMNYFELVLTLLVIISGVIYLADVLYFEKKRKAAGVTHMAWPIEYSRSFFWVLLLVLVIRSFWFEPFRIPSGSLRPTLKIGDFIVVNKYAYGLRLPVLHTKVINVSEPKVGDIVVFRSPVTKNIDLIKRIVGVPGDRISYINKVIYINGKPMTQQMVGKAEDGGEGITWNVIDKTENLEGVKHHIWVRPDTNISGDFQNILVPPGKYFAMGDNRDNSNDSRFWGFVPEENIIGQAKYVIISWDGDTNSIRWSRFGEKIV